MLNNLCQIGIAVKHQIGNALAVIAVYAKGLGAVSLLVVIYDQYTRIILLRQRIGHADGGQCLSNAAFEVDDRYGFHKIPFVVVCSIGTHGFSSFHAAVPD